jgi:general secretion pathway protein A
MYEDFYGLKDRPFKLSPDPAYYFASKQHSRARAYLEYGMHQNEGFIVITGDVGAGKTTIIRSVLDSLDSSKILAANLVSTQVDAEDTLRLIGAAFGLKVKDIPKSELLMTIEAGLLHAATNGKRCLLIVDEAQSLTPRAVEELRMLSNFQLGNRALLQSFLVGQPEFREIMQSPGMQQLRQRVIASCHIGPLMDDEIQPYITHRMKVAGWRGEPLFDVKTCVAINRATGGIPRRINMVCDRMLLKGFLLSSRSFGSALVNEVAADLAEETIGSGAIRQPAPQTEAAVQPVPLRPPAAPPAEAPLRAMRTAFGGHEEEPAEGAAGGLGYSAESIAALVAAEVGERIAGIEDKVARLERTTAAILALLQRLVVGAPGTDNGAPAKRSKAERS